MESCNLQTDTGVVTVSMTCFFVESPHEDYCGTSETFCNQTDEHMNCDSSQFCSCDVGYSYHSLSQICIPGD